MGADQSSAALSLAMPFPAFHPEVFHTAKGVPYLREPGVVLLAMPQVNLLGMQGFLDSFDPDLGFTDFLADPTQLPPAELLAKVSGQVCYLSFGRGRTMNADVVGYLNHIKDSGHGSVFEHGGFTFLWYGISRSVTHELVRHRIGVAYSQVSQRYVSGRSLRFFVERPEYVDDPVLHADFEEWIELSADQYERRASRLLELQQSGDSTILSADARTERRKKVNQAARSCLPNETEAPIIVTVNGRSGRHITEMRASDQAETEIRRAAVRTFGFLKQIAPILFDDYTIVDLPDGTQAVSTRWRKV